METGNMDDINRMSMKDYYGLMRYLKYRDKKIKGEKLPLKDSQREMIRRAQEREKHGRK